ncbi:MAG TPA: PfkB family carbohydrate kinase [Streptosporangiaceae bacterium]
MTRGADDDGAGDERPMTVSSRFGYPPSPDRPRPAPRRLVLAGEAIVDVVMRVPALPERGGDMLAESGGVTAGGGFNVMAAAARHGLPVIYAGGHGTGPWGDLVRAALAAEGIRLLRPPDPERDTGFDVALVEPDAERTFVTQLGAEAMHGPGSWDAVPAGPGDAVYLSGYGLAAPETGSVLGRWAAGLPPAVLLFLDPGPLVAQIPAAVLDPVLARCDWLSCNLRESALMAGLLLAHSGTAETDSGAHSAMRLHDRTARADIIVRAGAAGCQVALRTLAAPVHVPAPRVTAVDTTGAGDAHSGVFLAALADGLPPLDAAARANAAAAFAVTRPGPATAPTRAELDAWLSA